MTENNATPPSHPLPIVIVGHVDHGKSTLIGRLPDGKLAELKAQAARRGAPFEWSFVMDALQVERDQAITVDTTRVWFRTAARGYVIIDAPGHVEFLKNMVTGAAAAEAAVLVVDAAQGVSEQTRRHAYLLSLLGVRQVAVAVNKMDLVGHDRARFDAVAADIRDYLAEIGIAPQAVIPLSARGGDNVATPARQAGGPLGWWDGPSLTGALDGFAAHAAPTDRPLRLPVQDVYRQGGQRIVVGRVESGIVRVGDEIAIAPGGRRARVAAFHVWNGSTPLSAGAGQSVAIALDREVYIERGHIVAAPDAVPDEANRVRVRLFWLDRESLATGERLTLRLGAAEHSVVVESVERVIDVQALAAAEVESVPRNGVAEIVLRGRSRIVHDPFERLAPTGRAVLLRAGRIVGGCVLRGAVDVASLRNLTSVEQTVTPADRAVANGHRGGVLWLTGLSGSGKSTLAMALQRRLFEAGRQVYVLDGDNVRQGLNRDLGFSPEDRTENIRRIAEVARLFADAGFIVLTAFISPYREDRDNARAIVGESFREVYVRADLAICEERDPKGLYVRARAGEIPEFTGITAPYEAPPAPELTVDTGVLSVDGALHRLVDLVEADFGSGARPELAAGE